MPAQPLSRNLTGMLVLALGIMLFSVQDAIIKAVSSDYALTEAIVIRSLVALPILVAMVQAEAGLTRLARGNIGGMIARGLILLVSYTSYYMAIAALPLAEAIALFFVSPVMVTLLAGPILGERVSLKSWLAVGIGFVGVLIILQPGSAVFKPAALLSLVSAAAYGLAMVLARKMGASAPASVMSFHQNGVYLLGALVIAGVCGALGLTRLDNPALDFLLRPWATPTLRDFLMMAACGVIAAVAMALLTQAYRLAEANLVTVFEYSGMIWAPLWGFLFFAEVPRWTTFAGMALIVAAGLYSARAAAGQAPKVVAVLEA